MQKWADHAPANFLNKFYLVEAEKARVMGKMLEAEDYYEKAIKVLQSISVDWSFLVANSIINYVVNTGETVVLKNASCEGKFISDPYIKEKKSKSILCLPLIN